MTVMNVTHNIFCSGFCPGGQTPEDTDIELNLWDHSKEWNLRLNLDQIHSCFYQNASPRFIDFLEIATYVYCADQVFTRGGLKDVDKFGAAWRRHFHFHIPVRDLNFWSSPQVLSALEETLHFLSEDYYEFSFPQAKNAPEIQEYLEFSDNALSAVAPEQVMMFSGGLDSLGGAIQEAVRDQRKVMLVNHRSTDKLNTVHRNLMQKLRSQAGDFAPDHIHVDINKKVKQYNKEYTQRTRSFLFLALGSSVANMLGLDSLRFYENGVISFNLPLSAQSVGSRSTRTTHPQVIHLYSKLVSLITEKPFRVENPFIWKTRGEIIKLIVDAGCSDLIRDSMSCAHVWQCTTEGTHCGICSQCIDRRIGMIAAGADKYDPETIYRKNVFLEEASKEEDQLLNAQFLERANRIDLIKDQLDFFQKYPELAKALPFLEGSTSSSLSRCFNLYKRHAAEVTSALDALLGKYASVIRKRSLAANCILRMVHESNAPESVSVAKLPEAKETEAPDYLLRQEGAKWKVVFDGAAPFYINDTLGARYASCLLHRVGESIAALELEQHIRSEKEDVRTAETVTAKHDQKALKQYAKELGRLRAERDSMLEEGRAVEADELAGDIEKLERILSNENKAVLSDSGEKARNNVRKALDALERGLKKMDEPAAKDFARHLSSFVSKGITLSYIPSEKITWS